MYEGILELVVGSEGGIGDVPIDALQLLSVGFLSAIIRNEIREPESMLTLQNALQTSTLFNLPSAISSTNAVASYLSVISTSFSVRIPHSRGTSR